MTTNQDVFKAVIRERTQLINLAAKIAVGKIMPGVDLEKKSPIERENLLRNYITALSQYLGPGVNYYQVSQGNPHPPASNPGANYSALPANIKSVLQQAKKAAEKIVNNAAFKKTMRQLESEGLSTVEAVRTWMFNPKFAQPSERTSQEVLNSKRFNKEESRKAEKQDAAIKAKQRAERKAAIEKAKKELGTKKVKIVHGAKGTVIKPDIPEPKKKSAIIEGKAEQLLDEGKVANGQAALEVAEQLYKQEQIKKWLLPALIVGGLLMFMG